MRCKELRDLRAGQARRELALLVAAADEALDTYDHEIRTGRRPFGAAPLDRAMEALRRQRLTVID